MVTKELLGPPDVLRAQALCIHELTEVVVVRKDKDLVFAIFQIVALSLKGFNNSQELLIVGLVAGLSGDHFSREESNWMPLTNFRQ